MSTRNARAIGFSFLIIGMLFGAGGSLHARAQEEPDPVCTPACATGTYCTYIGATGTNTACTANNTVDANGNTDSEITVTALKTTPTTSSFTFASFVSRIVGIVNSYIIPLIYALAFLYFVFGVVRYTFLDSSKEGKTKARQMMIFGILGMVVLFAVWGFVGLLLGTFTGLTGESTSI